MKRVSAIILALILLLGALTGVAESADVLTAEAWETGSGDRLEISADGGCTAVTKDGFSFQGSWTLNGSSFVFVYELYGQREMRAELKETDGIISLVCDGGNVYFPVSQIAKVREAAKENSKAYPIEWGQKVQLQFVTFQVDKAQVYRSLAGSSGFGIIQPEQAGSKYFALVGTLKNTSGAEMNMSRVKVEMTFDGSNTYTGGCQVDYSGKFNTNLVSQGSGPLYLYAAVPDEIINGFSTVSVRIGMNEGFRSTPGMIDQSDYLFEIQVDPEKAAEARKEPPRKKEFYEESPSLPIPTSYADVKQSTYNKSSLNGKVTQIKYSYRLAYDSDDGNVVFAKYIQGLRADGYAVKQSGKNYTVSNGKKKLATVTYDKTKLTVNITPGNGKLKTLPKPQAASGASAQPAETNDAETEKTYKLGDTLKTSYAQLKLTKSGKSSKIVSYTSKKQPRNWHYKYADSGNSLFYVFGNFKNLGKQSVDIRRIYAEVTFDGENVYQCELAALRKDGTDFVNDVAAKAALNCYVFAEVPAAVAKNFKTCTLKIGMSPEFGMHYITNGRLNFDLCDDVFTVKVK